MIHFQTLERYIFTGFSLSKFDFNQNSPFTVVCWISFIHKSHIAATNSWLFLRIKFKFKFLTRTHLTECNTNSPIWVRFIVIVYERLATARLVTTSFQYTEWLENTNISCQLSQRESERIENQMSDLLARKQIYIFFPTNWFQELKLWCNTRN